MCAVTSIRMLFFLLNINPTAIFYLFFFNDTATTEIYTLSLHDALPIYQASHHSVRNRVVGHGRHSREPQRLWRYQWAGKDPPPGTEDPRGGGVPSRPHHLVSFFGREARDAADRARA